MLKTKDFYLLKVYDIRGKYLGIIDDIYVDFNEGIIKGFLLSNYLVKKILLGLKILYLLKML